MQFVNRANCILSLPTVIEKEYTQVTFTKLNCATTQ